VVATAIFTVLMCKRIYELKMFRVLCNLNVLYLSKLQDVQ